MSENEPIKLDFSQLISAFGMQSLMACGKIMNPITRKFETDLMMAQYHIGLLEIIQAKTTGNLTDEESRLLEDMLHQARMAFLDAQRGIGKVQAE